MKSEINNNYVIGVDIGTTTIRACLFDSNYNLLNFAEEKIEIITDSSIELHIIDPDVLWKQFQTVLLTVVKQLNGINKTISVGLCCQRNTFISWNSHTLIHCHPLVTWKDGRGKLLCKAWNNSFTLKFLNMASAVLYFFTGSQRFKALKMLKFVNTMVTQRFLASLKQDKNMQKLLENKCLAVGCLDTWLIAKLTNGKYFITESSSASCTGLFDLFLNSWNWAILRFIGFPTNVLLPHILDTNKIDALIECSEFSNNISLKINAIIGDAQAAVFGSGCYINNSLSISLGTGTFIDFVVKQPQSSIINGLYPLVGWRIDGKSKYLVEAYSNNTASLIDWAQKVNIISLDNNLNEKNSLDYLSNIAELTTPDESLHFITGFDGLQTPINDEHACAAFLGLKISTTREQMLRSILDAITFTVYQLFETFNCNLPNFKCNVIRCSGGVSNNNFICQQIANLINAPLERIENNIFAASKGAALIAGISSGIIIYDNVDSFIRIQRKFYPLNNEIRFNLLKRYQAWKKAQKRCLNFYD